MSATLSHPAVLVAVGRAKVRKSYQRFVGLTPSERFAKLGKKYGVSESEAESFYNDDSVSDDAAAPTDSTDAAAVAPPRNKPVARSTDPAKNDAAIARPKGKRGRPAKYLDQEFIREMVAHSLVLGEMASLLNVSIPTVMNRLKAAKLVTRGRGSKRDRDAILRANAFIVANGGTPNAVVPDAPTDPATNPA